MNSAEYWRLREEKQHAKNIKNEKEYDNKIKEIYRNIHHNGIVVMTSKIIIVLIQFLEPWKILNY